MAHNKPLSLKLKKRRQLLLVLPLLILPFVTLAFWALGGGQREVSGRSDTKAGINSTVPSANLSFRPEDKMSLYAESDGQAQARKEALGQYAYPGSGDSTDQTIQPPYNLGEDPNSKKVEQKLTELQAIVGNSGAPRQTPEPSISSVDPATYGLQPGEQSRGRLDQLNQLNELIAGSTDADSDDDARQINTMLNKILAIQHPEQTGDKLKALSRKNKGRIYRVQRSEEDVEVPLLPSSVASWKTGSMGKDPKYPYVDPISSLTANRKVDDLKETQPVRYSNSSTVSGAFYDIDTEKPGDDESHYTMPAVMAETQTLVSGGTVKMRLTTDAFINGTLIRKGSFVYGTCSVNGERLQIAIKNIRFQNQLFPVHLTVYDLDGMVGVRIPGAIGRDASKEGADRALQSVQMMSLDPSVATQAAAAGIEATKGLLSKKVKLIRVTVKAGYPVLLLDDEGLQQEDK